MFLFKGGSNSRWIILSCISLKLSCLSWGESLSLSTALRFTCITYFSLFCAKSPGSKNVHDVDGASLNPFPCQRSFLPQTVFSLLAAWTNSHVLEFFLSRWASLQVGRSLLAFIDCASELLNMPTTTHVQTQQRLCNLPSANTYPGASCVLFYGANQGWMFYIFVGLLQKGKRFVPVKSRELTWKNANKMGFWVFMGWERK